MLLSATTLPLVVALTQIGLSTGTMLPENAAALVGAGVLSVLFFPLIATAIHARRPPRAGAVLGGALGSGCAQLSRTARQAVPEEALADDAASPAGKRTERFTRLHSLTPVG